MVFLLNPYHDANSYKDWNPYYKMVSREKSQKFLDEGKDVLTKNECYSKLYRFNKFPYTFFCLFFFNKMNCPKY